MLVPIIGCRKSAAEEYLTQIFCKKITIPSSGIVNNYIWKDGTLYKQAEGKECLMMSSVFDENTINKVFETCHKKYVAENQNADIQYCLAF